MLWPFTKRDRQLRAAELDRMSQLKGRRVSGIRSEMVRVTLEEDHFAIRQEHSRRLLRQCKTASECERWLIRYYRDLVYNSQCGY